MKRSIVFFFLLVLPFISNGQGTQYTGAPTQVNAIRGGAKADSAQWLPIGFAIYPWFDSTGRIWYNPIDSSLYYHTGHRRVKVGSGGGGSSSWGGINGNLTDQVDLYDSLKNRLLKSDSAHYSTPFYTNSQGFLKAADIAGKLNKSDSNILGGYQSRYLWLADSALIMSNFSLYVRYQDTANMLNPYLRKADAAGLYYSITNPSGYITIIPVNDTAAILRTLINTKVSLSKYATDSAGFYLALGDTASALRTYIASLPAYGINTTDLTHWNTAYNKYVVSSAFNAVTGNYVITLNDATTISTSLDGRYLKLGDWVADSTNIQDSLNTKVGKTKYVADSLQNVVNIADTANSIRAWANGQFYLASNPNNYTDNTPLIDTAAAHLALINSKVSLAKHTTDSIQYYLSLGDTASAIRAFIASLPNYGISTTDITHWNTAYNKYIVSHSFNPATGVLTITLNDATTVTANLDGRYTLKTDLTNDSIAFYTALNDTALAHMLLINSKQNYSDTLTYDATKKNLIDTALRLQVAINTKVDMSKYRVDSSMVIRQGGDQRNTPDSIGTKDNTGTVFLANGVGVVFINSSGLMSIGAVSDGASGMYVSGHKIRANLSSPNQNTYEGGYNGNTYYLMLGDGSATFGSAPPTANAYQIGITPFSNVKIGLVIRDYDTTTSNNVDLTQWQSQTGRVLSRVTHTGGVVWGDTVKVNAFQYLNSTPQYSTGGDSMLVKNSTTKRVETIPVIAYVDSVKRIGDTVWYYKAGVKTFAFTDSLASGGGSGTVTSVATSKGILGGTITTSGTLIVDTVGTSGTAVATQAWVTNKSYLTSYTETDPLYTANGLKKSDTASLVVSYARLNTAQANDVKYTDTVGMSNRINLRIPYADTSVEIATIAYGNVHWGGSSIDTTALSNRINLKQNFTDTAAWDATRAWVNSKGYLTTNQTVTLSGDVTGSGGTAITTTLKNTGTAGTYGDATHVPQFTTDAQGRVTAVTAVAITGGGGGGGGELLNIQYLKTGTTYTPTTGTNTIVIDMVGGGGGGGAVPASSSSSSSGSGGGAGGRLIKKITSVSGTYTYSIGGGGAGGVAGTNNGSAGGNTTFVNGATTYTANGGSGGVGDGTHTGSTGASNAGGTGGVVSTNGDVNTGGMPGNPGFTFTTIFQSSGSGGSTLYGGGGAGMVTITGAGNNATGYGAGGGGAASSVISTTAKAGGNGTQGIIIVYEYN